MYDLLRPPVFSLVAPFGSIVNSDFPRVLQSAYSLVAINAVALAAIPKVTATRSIPTAMKKCFKYFFRIASYK